MKGEHKSKMRCYIHAVIESKVMSFEILKSVTHLGSLTNIIMKKREREIDLIVY